jgi:pilus assembly protein CpaF
LPAATIPGIDIDDYYAHLGPLEALIRDERVTEIMVNGPTRIFVEMKGKIVATGLTFADEQSLMAVIDFIVGSIGRRVDSQSPMADARLADGSRVNVAIRPVAIDGPSITIRKFAKEPMRVDDLIGFGSCTEAGFGFMKACVLAMANIVVSGGTGTGKTTFLNVLSGFIPADERIVTIEDAAELQLDQDHVVRLESQPADIKGEGKIAIRDLVVNALRMRPERIIVGECRSGEALDMLQAMNTGHDGSMTTLHANSPREALSRLETLVLMAGIDLPLKAIRQQMAGAVDIVVQLNRLKDGSRRVTSITEVVGIDGDVVTMQELFRFVPKGAGSDGRILGEFEATRIRPRLLEKMVDKGLELPAEIAALYPNSGIRIAA